MSILLFRSHTDVTGVESLKGDYWAQKSVNICPLSQVVNMSKIVSKLWYWFIHIFVKQRLGWRYEWLLSNILWFIYEKWIDKVQRWIWWDQLGGHISDSGDMAKYKEPKKNIITSQNLLHVFWIYILYYFYFNLLYFCSVIMTV